VGDEVAELIFLSPGHRIRQTSLFGLFLWYRYGSFTGKFVLERSKLGLFSLFLLWYSIWLYEAAKQFSYCYKGDFICDQVVAWHWKISLLCRLNPTLLAETDIKTFLQLLSTLQPVVSNHWSSKCNMLQPKSWKSNYFFPCSYYYFTTNMSVKYCIASIFIAKWIRTNKFKKSLWNLWLHFYMKKSFIAKLLFIWFFCYQRVSQLSNCQHVQNRMNTGTDKTKKYLRKLLLHLYFYLTKPFTPKLWFF
jgi:hypothetical protein